MVSAPMLAACAVSELDPVTGALNGDGAIVSDEATPATLKLVHEGQLQFTNGHYGLAVDAYAKSVERDPLNAEAWLGLGASYDQIGRFDLADRAYGKAQGLVGATPTLLNNIGYSYLLRGNLDRSRDTLKAAYALDPNNPYIVNNIDLLNEKLVALGQRPLAVDEPAVR